MRSLLLAISVLMLIAPSAFAGKVKKWTAAAPAHWEKATFQNAAVSSEGAIRLARQLQPFDAAIDASRIWDVVEDRNGNLFVATGDDGKIFKIAADNKVTVAFDGEDSQVFCLLAAPDGTIFAGAGPSGRIIRIDPTGNAGILHDSAESYIWALAYDETGKQLFAATGPHGRIYQIDAGGKAIMLYQTNQRHVLCLARSPDGSLFAGTDKNGLIYQIDGSGMGKVLFQTAQSEVRCLRWTKDAIYAGTSSPGSVKEPPGSPQSAAPIAKVASLVRPAPDRAEAQVPIAVPATADKPRDGDKGVAALAPRAPGSGENSVYRIGFDGSVRELFRDKGLVLTVLPHGDRLFVGTGVKGHLFEVTERTKEFSELARLDSGQLQKLIVRKDGSVVVASADPARLFLLRDSFAAKGQVLTEVIDAKLASRWGAMTWQAQTPPGTRLTVAARSGNVREPDDTWSVWSAEQIDSTSAAALVPPGRYVQLRVTLQSDDSSLSPALQHITVRYASFNQAPEINKLDKPKLDGSKKFRFNWTAVDANEDELVYDLHIRKAGWSDWVRIEENWKKPEYEWDATTVPSGEYQLKVVASDRTNNSAGETLAAERVSLPFVVAHEAPAVRLKFIGIEKNRAVFEAEVASPWARLASASVALDSGKWTNAFPADGLFDGKRETIRFETEPLPAGTHVVVLRVSDSAGNTGAADAVVRVPARDK